jgi:hypothetical protein
MIRLHHGTDVNSAQDILQNGLNQANAASPRCWQRVRGE